MAQLHKIPIFCLTLLGSQRHKDMHEHLVEMTASNGCHFEFVNGQSSEDIPFAGAMDASIAKAVFDRDGSPSLEGLSNVCRAMNVKTGMSKMMQRIIDLRCQWAFAIQDDVILMPNWLETCNQTITELQGLTDRISMTYLPKRKAGGGYHILQQAYCTETASLVTPEFCHRYIAANKKTRFESDAAMKVLEGEAVVSAPHPAAYLRCTKSTIAVK